MHCQKVNGPNAAPFSTLFSASTLTFTSLPKLATTIHMAKVPLTAILSFYFTSIQMDEKVIIDCIGPSVLTITISGATHSVAIATDVIKISGGRGDHGLDFLPLIYDAAALGGRLNICDGAGKMIYCWRSAVVLQSIIEPDPVLPSTSSNRVESTTASLCTNDLSRMSTGMSPIWGSIACGC